LFTMTLIAEELLWKILPVGVDKIHNHKKETKTQKEVCGE